MPTHAKSAASVRLTSPLLPVSVGQRLDALENGRASDIGVSKLSRILAVLGLELNIRPSTNRPTLDELLKVAEHD